MKSLKYTIIVAGLFCMGSVLVACGDDGGTSNKDTDNKGTDSDTGEPDAGNEDSETVEPVHPDVAYEENFDEWDGGGSFFFMSKPDPTDSNIGGELLDDNNTAQSIDEHDCVMFHALSGKNWGYGTAIEAQFQFFEAGVDMSGEDYHISFDVYVPQEMKDKHLNIQFALFNTSTWEPIYSIQYDDQIPGDTWTTIEADIVNNPDVISYSGFDKTVNPNADPELWQFDVVRIQAVIPPPPEGDTGADADAGVDGGAAEEWPTDEEGVEIRFYLDNLVVKLKDAK